MREATLLVAIILTAGVVPLGGQATEGDCIDSVVTFSGLAIGVPDEYPWRQTGSYPAASVDANVHSAAFGSPACAVASLKVVLSAQDPVHDLDLYVYWDGVPYAKASNPTPNEMLQLASPPWGSYSFRVAPVLAAASAYTLSVTADVSALAPLSGPNAAKPFVVIALVDTGINPYHMEFRASGYPDQSIDLFAHPSTYIEGYPWWAQRFDLSLDMETYLEAYTNDRPRWLGLAAGQLHWFPGTKVIGGYHGGGGISDSTVLLDTHGHGTAVAGMAAGNSVGTCPRCLIVAVEGTGGLEWALRQRWIDLVSNSWAFITHATPPTFGVAETPVFPESAATRSAAARGQTVLFAAGNGMEGSFLTPNPAFTADERGPPWIVTVSAIWKEGEGGAGNESIVYQSGKTADVSSYGLGDIPAPSKESYSHYIGFGGTSAATPTVAGVMGDCLLHARTILGDTVGNSRGGVPARGTPASGMLSDGMLTRVELESAIEHTAEHTYTDSSEVKNVGDEDWTVIRYNNGQIPQELRWAQWAAEGWGIVHTRTGDNAKAVIDGTLPLPDRPFDEAQSSADDLVRTALWGMSPP